MAAERGSAPVEAAFAILFVLLLALGVVQIALGLYGRNVAVAAAHEGARAAVEVSGTTEDAETVALQTIATSTGRLIDDLEVAAEVVDSGRHHIVGIRVTGVIRTLGPLSIPFPLDATVTAGKPGDVR